MVNILRYQIFWGFSSRETGSRCNVFRDEFTRLLKWVVVAGEYVTYFFQKLKSE
jgi:hypothetical protein